jgi:4-amino-4-deoxy-L-arabinose transferase-like glycosyltransferase
VKLRVDPRAEDSNWIIGFIFQRRSWLIMTGVLCFSLAMIIRVYGFYRLDAPGMIAERQFRSALIARKFYFELTNSVPEWRRQIVFTSVQRAGILEPPITELLVALVYRLVKGERLWIARLLSSIFWVAGGLFLFRITKRMVSVEAALFASIYYLFVPLGVVASISFLPEPLMIMMFLFSILTIIRHYEQPSKSRLIIAAVVSGLAILIKPFILFAVLGAFIALSIYRKTTWKRVFDFDFFIFSGICLSLSAFYYLYGIFIGKFLDANFQAGFLPYLFFQREFWERWLVTAANAVGLTPLIIALLGIPMLPKVWQRYLMIGLWIGYFLFGLAYTYPIRISGHYHLQLIVIVALCLGPILQLLTDYLRSLSHQWYWWIPVGVALILVLLFNFREVRGEFTAYRGFESEKIAEEIGEIVNHSNKVVYVATYYGMPLEYYGELSGTYWPRKMVNWDLVKDRYQGRVEQSGIQWTQRLAGWIFRRLDERELSIKDRFDILGISPEYFVISDLEDFKRNHTDLEEFLADDCPLLADGDKYLIYDVKDCTN